LDIQLNDSTALGRMFLLLATGEAGHLFDVVLVKNGDAINVEVWERRGPRVRDVGFEKDSRMVGKPETRFSIVVF